MNPTSKKFLSLFLIFSLMVLSGNLYAKKRGAELTIIKKDGHLIRGELIAVKEHSLLLLSATDVSIDIGDIKVIEIEKKSKIGKGAFYGGLIGAISGIGVSVLSASSGEWSLILVAYVFLTGAFAAAGGVLGGLIGAVVGTGEETIQIEGMSDSEIRETLNKLRKKARIRDYK